VLLGSSLSGVASLGHGRIVASALAFCNLDAVPSSDDPPPPLEDVLSKSQRNDLFVAVETSGVPVTEFNLKTCWVSEGDETHDKPLRVGVMLAHRDSESYFGVLPHPNRAFEIFGLLDDCEKLDTPNDRGAKFRAALKPSKTIYRGWSQIPSLAGTWAKKIVELRTEYANTPDMWAELSQGKRLLSGTAENTPFAAPEQTEVSGQIEQVKEFIKATYELTAAQIAEVEERLDQAEQASHRMGRKDWLLLFNGAVFSLVLSDLVPVQAVQHILLMTLHGLGHLFGVGAPLLHLPPGG
jgi:hypothetical protein